MSPGTIDNRIQNATNGRLSASCRPPMSDSCEYLYVSNINIFSAKFNTFLKLNLNRKKSSNRVHTKLVLMRPLYRSGEKKAKNVLREKKRCELSEITTSNSVIRENVIKLTRQTANKSFATRAVSPSTVRFFIFITSYIKITNASLRVPDNIISSVFI